MHIYVRPCVCTSVTEQIPLEPVMVQKSHAFPMLTHTKQWVPPRSLTPLSFSLSFSPCHVLFPSPSRSLAPVVTAAIIIPLCFQLIFSLTSSLEENNYQMGTPCFNSDFEVNDSLTFAGLFCSRLWNLPMFLFSPPTTPSSSLTPIHTSVHSEIALGVITVISHCRRSWRGTLRALRLRTLCPCSARC